MEIQGKRHSLWRTMLATGIRITIGVAAFAVIFVAGTNRVMPNVFDRTLTLRELCWFGTAALAYCITFFCAVIIGHFAENRLVTPVAEGTTDNTTIKPSVVSLLITHGIILGIELLLLWLPVAR